MTQILGFGCRARQGKDACCNAILKAHAWRMDIRKYAFADRMKMEVSEAIKDWGSPGRFFAVWASGGMRDAPNKPDWVVMEPEPPMDDPLCPYGKFRTLLQWWGSNYRRAQEADYWVKLVAADIKRDNPTFALISDVRFPNEFDWIHANCGKVIRVTREGYSIPGTHISESALDNHVFDHEIHVKDGELDVLEELAVEVFDRLTKEQ